MKAFYTLIILLIPFVGFGQKNINPIIESDKANVKILNAFVDTFPNISIYLITEKNNEPIFGLKKNNFSVKEDNKSCDILNLKQKTNNSSVNIVVVIDKSPSIFNSIEEIKTAASNFISLFESNLDSILIVGFNENVTSHSKFLNFQKDSIDLFTSINSIYSGGYGTAFYDAIDKSINMLKNKNGLNIVVALTDGVDNSSSKDIKQITKNASDSRIPVYTIGFQGTNYSKKRMNRTNNPDTICISCLDFISASTDGKRYNTSDINQLENIYSDIYKKIASIYKLTYKSSNFIEEDTIRLLNLNFKIDDDILNINSFYNVDQETIRESKKTTIIFENKNLYILTITLAFIVVLIFVYKKS